MLRGKNSNKAGDRLGGSASKPDYLGQTDIQDSLIYADSHSDRM